MKTVHYGLWHPEQGWYWNNMEVWTTTVRSIALAQCSLFHRGIGWMISGDERWKVRTLLEWEISEGSERIAELEWRSDRIPDVPCTCSLCGREIPSGGNCDCLDNLTGAQVRWIKDCK